MVNENTQRGFTLQELLVSLAIFFILGGLGVPSYISYSRNAELSNATTSLFTDMYYARSEAIKRKTPIMLCRSADANAAAPVCGGTANNWSTGWLVFIDVGGTAGVYDAGTDTLLKVGSPPTGNVQIRSNASANSAIEYTTDGSLNTVYAPAIFAICDDRDSDGVYEESHGRNLRVGPIGRPEITTGSIPSCINPV